MSTQITFDLIGLTRAVERHDRRYQLALYADDARVEILDSGQPDGPRRVLQGKPAIGEWLDGIATATVHNEIRDAVVQAGAVGYTEECRYADGSKVLLKCSAKVRRGQICQAAVTRIHTPGSEPMPQPGETESKAAKPIPRGSERQASSRPWPDRPLPGNFLG